MVVVSILRFILLPRGTEFRFHLPIFFRSIPLFIRFMSTVLAAEFYTKKFNVSCPLTFLVFPRIIILGLTRTSITLTFTLVLVFII